MKDFRKNFDVVLKIANGDGFSDYDNGLEPNYEILEDKFNLGINIVKVKDDLFSVNKYIDNSIINLEQRKSINH